MQTFHVFYLSYLETGEHIKNWRHRYFVLLDDGSLLGFKNKPESSVHLGLAEPLNNFTVKGCQIMKAVIILKILI